MGSLPLALPGKLLLLSSTSFYDYATSLPIHLLMDILVVSMCMLSHFSCVWLFATLWTVAHRLLRPWDSPSKITGVGCHFLLLGIFLTWGLNLHLLHWQADSEPPGKPLCYVSLQYLAPSIIPPWTASLGLPFTHCSSGKHFLTVSLCLNLPPSSCGVLLHVDLVSALKWVAESVVFWIEHVKYFFFNFFVLS